MKVIHVTNNSEKNLLGIHSHILNLAAAQKARGYGVLVIVDRPGVFTDACGRLGVPVAVARELKPEDRPMKQTPEKTIGDLARKLSTFDSDLVHCHSPHVARHVIPACNRIRKPAVVTVHTQDPGQAVAARRSGLKFTTIAVSKDVFNELKTAGMSETEVYHVANGTETVSPGARQETGRPRRPNLIFVGTPILAKGIDVAIMAMVELRRRLGRDCPALDVYGADTSMKGSEGEADYAREMVGTLGMTDLIHFHGLRPGILESCSSSNILVLPSRGEAAPLVILEAMSRGMPIVATDTGDVAEVIPDPRFGRAIPANSVAALADAIEETLLDVAEGRFNPTESIERHRALYTREKMAEGVEAVYERSLRDTSHSAAAPRAVSRSL